MSAVFPIGQAPRKFWIRFPQATGEEAEPIEFDYDTRDGSIHQSMSVDEYFENFIRGWGGDADGNNCDKVEYAITEPSTTTTWYAGPTCPYPFAKAS